MWLEIEPKFTEECWICYLSCVLEVWTARTHLASSKDYTTLVDNDWWAMTGIILSILKMYSLGANSRTTILFLRILVFFYLGHRESNQSSFHREQFSGRGTSPKALTFSHPRALPSRIPHSTICGRSFPSDIFF